MIDHLISFFTKNGKNIITAIVILLLGVFWQRSCTENKQLKETNKTLLLTNESLYEQNELLAEGRAVDAELRKDAEDSILVLQQKDIELTKEVNRLNWKHEKFKNDLTDINTDHKRDSLLSAWYPAPGQRGIR